MRSKIRWGYARVILCRRDFDAIEFPRPRRYQVFVRRRVRASKARANHARRRAQRKIGDRREDRLVILVGQLSPVILDRRGVKRVGKRHLLIEEHELDAGGSRDGRPDEINGSEVRSRAREKDPGVRRRGKRDAVGSRNSRRPPESLTGGVAVVTDSHALGPRRNGHRLGSRGQSPGKSEAADRSGPVEVDRIGADSGNSGLVIRGLDRVGFGDINVAASEKGEDGEREKGDDGKSLFHFFLLRNFLLGFAIRVDGLSDFVKSLCVLVVEVTLALTILANRVIIPRTKQDFVANGAGDAFRWSLTTRTAISLISFAYFSELRLQMTVFASDFVQRHFLSPVSVFAHGQLGFELGSGLLERPQ